MGVGPVTFNYAAWTAIFPELSAVSEPAASGYFNMATLYIRNDGGGPINDVNMQTTLLNLATAHIAKLFSMQTAGLPVTGGTEPPGGAVGRVSSATEGSVTAQLDIPPDAANQGWWWLQTPYGAAAWQAMKPYRTFRYVGPTNRRTYNPPARYRGNLGGI